MTKELPGVLVALATSLRSRERMRHGYSPWPRDWRHELVTAPRVRSRAARPTDPIDDGGAPS